MSFIRVGKTFCGIILSSRELQQGRSVLYCSASAKPLKELFERLPAEMRKICLDVSSLEHNDDEDAAIKDFCDKLECMQMDLKTMKTEEEKEQKYTKKIEVCSFRTYGGCYNVQFIKESLMVYSSYSSLVTGTSKGNRAV